MDRTLQLTNPHFELLKTSDIEVSKDKRPMINSNESKAGLVSLISILIISFPIVILTILVLSSSSKLSEIDKKLIKLSLSYETDKQKGNETKEAIINQKTKNDNLLLTIKNSKEELDTLRKANEKLNEKEDEINRKIEDFKNINEKSDKIVQMDIDKIKAKLVKCKYHFTLKFEKLNKENRIFKDSVILTTQKEIDFLEKITESKLQSVCYSSKRDTLSGSIFIDKCYNIAPTLVLFYIDNGIKFGGYTVKTWELHLIKDDPKSFMFNLSHELLFSSNKPHWDMSTGLKGLPQFGYGDLKIFDDGIGRSHFPSTFGDSSDKDPNKLTNGVNYFYTYILEVFSLNPM